MTMGSQVARRLKGRAARGWRCLSAVALALCMTQAFAINLKVGELKIMNPGDIDRVAVGNANVISTSLLKNGQLLVFGEAPGLTTLHLWLKNGQESQVEFTVDKSDYSAAVNSGVLQQKLAAVKKLVMDIPGLEAAVVGDKIVLSGQYDGRYAPQVAAVKAAYPEALDLSISTKLAEVKQLVADIKGIDVRLVGSRIVLSGTIDDGYEATINTIMGAYPDVMDLTRKEEVELPDDKMVLVNIKITEFNKSASDSLGINWSNNFAGPAAAIASETTFGGSRDQGVSVIGGSNAPGPLASVDPAADTSFGYFGIATEITSRINLAINTGNAMILAEPRLVARSGGEAKFLAGGEVPIEIVTPTSASIEFKQFGILLNIKPTIDRNDNIRAHVETEISAVDKSVAVGNTPGFLTRRTDADILLHSGETLVMSGLVDRELGRDLTGLKGLSSLPILGHLFRSRDFRDKKTDLVIFVTPQVYDAEHKQNIDAVAAEKAREDTFLESMRTATFKLVE
ncbi:MAG: pilus assembly protein N-terminal domain-containing protein [Proteobacteria bacterium]|nr:pilus assembly protein N-terminal domain-containing protein [Pseudomonadota bacterium]